MPPATAQPTADSGPLTLVTLCGRTVSLDPTDPNPLDPWTPHNYATLTWLVTVAWRGQTFKDLVCAGHIQDFKEQGREGFKPQVGQHKGAGYQSNYRPMINYHPSLDTLDNPAVGELIKDNAHSVFTQSYCPMELPDGSYPLSWSVYQPGSGYANEKTHSCPPSKEGPRFMTSEYASKYRYEVPAQPDFLQKKTIGAKEESGFTEQTTKNPAAFQPLPGDPLPPPSRSTTRADFVPMTTPHGDEYLPVLAKGSERETGFSRLKEKVFPPAPPPGPLSISEPSSMSHRQYQGKQWMPQTTNAMLGREILGSKEPSGFSTNNPGYNRGPPDPDRRFLTTYNQRTLTALDPFYRDNPHSPGFSALHAPS